MAGNTIKRGWRDVTINEYFDLCERMEETEELENQDYLRAVVKIAFANGMSEDEVWDLSISQFRQLQNEAAWIERFELNENVKFKSVTIDGDVFNVDVNLQNFKVGQYIDFQTFYKQYRTNKRVMGNILACFLIPKGKEYADGYDIKNVVETINEHLDIMTAEEILFFFLKSFLISTRATVNYLNWIMRRMERREKDKKKMEEIKAIWEETKNNILVGLRSLTTWGN